MNCGTSTTCKIIKFNIHSDTVTVEIYTYCQTESK